MDSRKQNALVFFCVLCYCIASDCLVIFIIGFSEDDVCIDCLVIFTIDFSENDECTSGNSSKHYGYDTPHCPTEYGSYIVPVLLGLHVMVTNVLLLNLLIARFG